MMKNCIMCLIAATLFTGMAGATKRLIEIGWDMPVPSYIAVHIRTMEQLPFDGLALKLNDNQVFMRTKWNADELQPEMDALQRIQWGTFTENFLYTNVSSPMDWFSDTDWESITYNAGLLAKAGQLGRLKGILLDPEPYGWNPWNYASQPHADDISFTKYQEKVHQRGAQFMQAIQQDLPSARIFTLFALSMTGDIAEMDDADARNRALTANDSFFAEYGLYPAFIDGMLAAANPEVLIIDGNEGSPYYFTTADQFARSRQVIRTTCMRMLSPGNSAKYQRQVHIAQPLYGDYLFHLLDISDIPGTELLTPAERARYAEHNAYYALQTADEYTWIWTERMNWWTNDGIPPGFAQALSSAKAKVNSGQPLGFSIATLVTKIMR